MSTYEIIIIAISSIAIIVSAIAIIVSFMAAKKTNELTKGQNELMAGQVELQLRAMISEAKRHYMEILSKNKNNDSQGKGLVRAALEELCNTYEELCAKYIDGKVDKVRLRKMYSTEVRRWVENEVIKDKYIEPYTQFNATIKVYKEWNNLEQ